MRATILRCDECRYEEETPLGGGLRPDIKAWLEVNEVNNNYRQYHFCSVECMSKHYRAELERKDDGGLV